MHDVGVSGRVGEERARDLPVGIGRPPIGFSERVIGAEEPLAHQLIELRGGGAGSQIAERLALIVSIGRISVHDVAGKNLDIVERTEQRSIGDDPSQVGQHRGGYRAVGFDLAKQPHHVGAIE